VTAPEAPMPAAPSVTPDPILDTLPGAVVASREDNTVLRIGVVTQIIEGSQITVRVSGSNVLVDCSYLFGQYFPLLGDRVVLFKQDSQWFCVGQMSGTISSNNPLFNSSFEVGNVATLPAGWSLTVLSSAGGVPTFEVSGSLSPMEVSGKQMVDFGTDSVGIGSSTADAFSTPIPTVEGTRWTGAYYLPAVMMNTVPPKFSQLQMYIQFLDSVSAVISEFQINSLTVGGYLTGPIYRRLSLAAFPQGYVAAPAGTSFVRVKFRGFFDLNATSFVSFFIDNVILRQVD
jgi:hypothetical protein